MFNIFDSHCLRGTVSGYSTGELVSIANEVNLKHSSSRWPPSICWGKSMDREPGGMGAPHVHWPAQTNRRAFIHAICHGEKEVVNTS